jgi:hypothetical protein
MKKFLSFLAVGSASVVFSAVAVAAPVSSDAKLAEAACKRYSGELQTRCLARAAQILKKYPRITKSLEKANESSSDQKDSSAAERKAKRLEMRSK